MFWVWDNFTCAKSGTLVFPTPKSPISSARRWFRTPMRKAKECNWNIIQRQQLELSNALIKSENDLHLIFQNYVDIFFMKIWKCKILMNIRKSGKYIGCIKVCYWNTRYRQQPKLSNTLIKSKMIIIWFLKIMLIFFMKIWNAIFF